MSVIYYKTKKTSEIGKKFAELWEKGEQADEAGRALAKKYNAESFVTKGGVAFGGIYGFSFQERPNSKIWKKLGGCADFFTPKVSTKEGRNIDNEMSAIPTIRRDDFSDLLPEKPPVYGQMGVVVCETYVYVGVLKEWKIKLPEEFTEIAESEWEKAAEGRMNV